MVSFSDCQAEGRRSSHVVVVDFLFLILSLNWIDFSFLYVKDTLVHYNHKLPRFFSRFWNPNTAGVDFFLQSLREENCWVVPPVSIVPRVLHYMMCQKAVGTVVVPFWPSAHYWPLVTSKYLKYFFYAYYNLFS